VTQLRKKMLEELQDRKTLCRKLSRAEIKGVSVTKFSSDLSDVERFSLRFHGPVGPRGTAS